MAHTALAVFLCVKHCYTRIMVGRAGAEKSAPVCHCAGYANPVRLTTILIGVIDGDSSFNRRYHNDKPTP
ncbi:ash family protein [Escherichia albertii]|uniref:ash family protein n=1 Tax=Escherichia albertii TaxID=208962 RepID=UPI000F0B379B